MRALFFILASFLILSCGSEQSYTQRLDYQYQYSPWSGSQIESETDSCVKGSLAGQTNYPELEADAKIFCSCLYKKISDNYSYYAYLYNRFSVIEHFFVGCSKKQ